MTLKATLDNIRQELLDLTFRNPLLNYRELKARGLRLIDERSNAVFQTLVDSGKEMTFLPKPKEKEILEEETTTEVDELGEPAEGEPAESEKETPRSKTRRRQLQTPYEVDHLDRRLRNTYHHARIFLEEQGVNVLFLTLGMLEWYESPASDNPRRSPLLLIPVELRRKDVRASFRLSYTGDDIVHNLTLQSKLKADFGLELPELDGENDINVTHYLDKVASIAHREARWSVNYDTITLGFFSYATFLMYNDLDLDNWSKIDRGELPPTLKTLFTAEEVAFQGSIYNEETMIDEYVTPENSHQVVDADSSQTLALLDINDGLDLVIQGPPGTGKSQTITNIIAEAIGANKKVLFVAEKMAALEVVKRRLDGVGLGDACLELHSHKTTKSAFLRELERTLRLGKPHNKLGDHLTIKLERNQDALNQYSHAVNAPIGQSGLSPYKLYGKLMGNALPDNLPEINADVMASWSYNDFYNAIDQIQLFQRAYEQVKPATENPFYGSTLSAPSLEGHFGKIFEQLKAVKELSNHLRNLFEIYSQLNEKSNLIETPLADISSELSFGKNFWRYFNRAYRATRKEILEELKNLQATVYECVKMMGFDPSKRIFTDGPHLQSTLPDIEKRIDLWHAEIDELEKLARYHHFKGSLEELQLKEIVDYADALSSAFNNIETWLEHRWYEKLLKKAIAERDALSIFDGETQNQRIENFKSLDTLQLEKNRVQLARRHFYNIPRSNNTGQTRILAREFQKKSRHKPIRKLMVEAGQAIQSIKPVFMMSPMSVATYLPPEAIEFDLVIFDEASQVRPADAFGAILRGKQVVVVGDDKQLPPTSFFRTIESDRDEEDEESVTADIESVLGVFLAAGIPSRMLRWHYRSQHDSLIALSNMEFYDHQLVVFPSPDHNRSELGLRYHHLPHTVYDRGGSSTNIEEAKAVAQAVIQHAERHPMLTLGVAAFSQRQMQAVLDQVEILRRQNSELEETFFNRHSTEPFFVKNLENVQGDERDVIFISIGYGRDAYGKVSQNFGPLNRSGGERRLNVLITRARQRCEIFTNLQAEDLKFPTARGLQALKGYLKFAETGQMEMPTISGQDPDSPFERAVGQAIREAGYDFAAQVGSAGFFIDLAVQDPHREGHFILAVECDGATYHSARSARDRDRLRQLVLERLGWTFHRIWSTDWFNNPQREIEKLIAAIEAAVAQKPEDPLFDAQNNIQPHLNGRNSSEIDEILMTTPIGIEREEEAPSETPTYEMAPYRSAQASIPIGDKPLHTVDLTSLATWMEKIVEVEGPIHQDLLFKRMAAATGNGRIGGRIRKALKDALYRGQITNRFVVKDLFIWPNLMHQIPAARNRSKLPTQEKKIEWIPSEEIQMVIKEVIKGGFVVDQTELVSETARLLGFSRTGPQIVAAIHRNIDALVNRQTIHREANQLSLKND